MKYKVICTDLDGTLLDTESQLSAENSEAIEALVNRGIIFVPTTGRTIIELPNEVRNHKSIRYFIYSNGAGIYDSKEDKAYEKLLDSETVGKILDVLEKYKIMLDAGATTFWETEIANKSPGGSLCHGWSALPIYYYEILR